MKTRFMKNGDRFLVALTPYLIYFHIPLTLWVRASFGHHARKPRSTACEPPHDKTNKMTCAPSEDSDQPGRPPSLIRVSVVRSMGS